MNSKQLQNVVKKTLKHIPAKEAHVSLAIRKNNLTRFSSNVITQNVLQETVRLSLSATVGKKTGTVVVNQFDDATLKSAGERAVRAAELAPPDPEYVPPVGKRKYPAVKSTCGRTRRFGPADRAAEIKKVAAMAKRKKADASGTFEIIEESHAVGNKKGMIADYRGDKATFTVTMTLPDSTGWAHGSDRQVQKLDPAALGKRALEKAVLSASPAPVKAGEHTVVLEPAAVADFLGYFFYLGSRRAADEGRSFGKGKFGKKVASNLVTLYSDPVKMGLPPFSGAGLPLERMDWIKNGKLAALPCDQYWARKKKLKPLSPGGTYGIEGGKTSLEEMIKSTDKGLLVTRFWYIRHVNPMNLLVTGMTRDGLFEIKKGKVTRGVRYLRFNEAILDALSRVVAVGPAERVGSRMVPPLKIENFRFTSETKF